MYSLKKKYQFRADHNIHTKEGIIKTGMIDYTLTIKLSNASLSSEGRLIEYSKLQEIRKYIGENIVHSNLDEIIKDIPTLENLSKYFFDTFYKIIKHLLYSVEISRSDSISVSYSPYNNRF